MIDVIAIDKDSINTIWPTVLPIMSKVLAYNEDTYTMADVKELLITGESILICITDDKKIISCITLQEEYHPTKKILHMPICCGERMDEWLDKLHYTIPKIAKEKGYDMIITKGRKGWGKVLKKYGFTERYTSYGREL